MVKAFQKLRNVQLSTPPHHACLVALMANFLFGFEEDTRPVSPRGHLSMVENNGNTRNDNTSAIT